MKTQLTFHTLGEPTEDGWDCAPLFEAVIDGKLIRADSLALLLSGDAYIVDPAVASSWPTAFNVRKAA